MPLILWEWGADPNSEKVVRLLREGSICTVELKPGTYDPLLGRSDEEKLEWHLFMLFLSFDRAARRGGMQPQDASRHVEYLLQRPFQNVAELLSDEGDKWRKNYGMRSPSEKFKANWAAFLAQHRDRTVPDVIKELEALQTRVEQEIASGKIKAHKPSGRRAA